MSDYPLSKVIVSASSAAVALACDAGGTERQEDIWVCDLTEEEAKDFLALHGHGNKWEDFVDACVSAQFNNMLVDQGVFAAFKLRSRFFFGEVEPTLLTGSPPCDQFSQLQNINKYRVSPDKRREKMDRAVAHLNTACRQVGSSCVRHATDRRGLQGTGYVRKETGWMTNHPALAQLLAGECTNNVPGKPWHRRIHLIGGLASPAARYPPSASGPEDFEEPPCREWPVGRIGRSSCRSNPRGELRDAGRRGAVLGRREWWVFATRPSQIELDYLRKQEVYEKVPLEECLRETNGKGPITTRWTDTNKGDRSRLVVREIKAHKSPEERIPQNMLFSSTPPLEAMRLLCSLWATERVSHQGRPLKIGLWDISRAHFYGVPKRRIYIQLPDEDASPGMVGRLTKSMYGTQDAPNI